MLQQVSCASFQGLHSGSGLQGLGRQVSSLKQLEHEAIKKEMEEDDIAVPWRMQALVT